MRYSTEPALNHLLRQCVALQDTAAEFLPLAGLSRGSTRIQLGNRTLVARGGAAENLMPGVDRQREYRILRKLAASGLAPRPCGYHHGWLLLEWQPGEVLAPGCSGQWLSALIKTLTALHRQSLSGYRLQLLPLLQDYWQRSHRRHPLWLRTLKRLQRQGEPHPLRLAPLHMDIHSGNLVSYQQQLHLIDWEYAGDGDVALELAALLAAGELDSTQQQQLKAGYAAASGLDLAILQRQIRRWQPWLALLATSWYELRWQQSGDNEFAALAADGWQRLKANKT